MTAAERPSAVPVEVPEIIDSNRVLDKEDIPDGTYMALTSFVKVDPVKPTKPKTRIAAQCARYKQRQATLGIRPLNIMSPDWSHDDMREINKCLREGTSVAHAIENLLVQRAAHSVSTPETKIDVVKLASIVADVAEALSRGGWRAWLILRLVRRSRDAHKGDLVLY